MRNISFIVYFFLVASVFVSCQPRCVSTSSENIPTGGWYMDSVVSLDIPIEESQSSTDWIVYVRHTVDYGYQNFWLFLDLQCPDGTLLTDTVECYLADHRGRWLGNGWGALREMPILWQQGFGSLQPGHYTLNVRHGMRTNVLHEISAIGVEIKKHKDGQK
jgi:gliding motility-associated lipoprotein GldH